MNPPHAPSPPPSYNIVWNSQSKDSSESMPCGGGDISLNVWVEDGDILFYISRSGSFAEDGEYLKLGRVRITLDPNPFNDIHGTFHQALKLRDGHVEITGTENLNDRETTATVRVWCEVHRPIIRVDIDANRDIQASATYENWRLEDDVLPDDTRRHSAFSLLKYPGDVTLCKDTITTSKDTVTFYHRNPDEDRLLPDLLIKQQGLEDYREQITDDLKNRTFGGAMLGDGFETAGETAGNYGEKEFRGWALRSKQPAKSHQLRIATHIAQSPTIEQWQSELDAVVANSGTDRDAAYQKAVEWWHSFWDRSWVHIHPDRPDATNPAWRVGRNYNLFRYQLGCNALGEYPTKFNGGSFTFDADLVGEDWSGRGFGPDWRQWGGDVFTAQNQRLLYWPLLKTGDADVIRPQFDLYRSALPGAKARVARNFKHDGALYSEYIGVPGLAIGMGYGWDSGGRARGEDIPFGDPRADAMHNYGDPVEAGVMACKPIAYHWESQLEHAYMILEYHRFTSCDISEYLSFIETAVVFFYEHYTKREQIRNGRDLDENKHLVIYPSKACESFRGATNPADIISGLHACLDLVLELDDAMLELRGREYYQHFRDTLPPLSFGETDGKRVALPAKDWGEYGNAELPMLYPLFPFNRFALGQDDMQVYIDTYDLGDFHKGNIWSWHQDGIFFARMGETDRATAFNTRKLDDSSRRFPTFWGPGHDWVPDHNWGGSGMIGLQEMLLQTIGDELRLLPAWPTDWDVDFKLHAPQKTTVQVSVRDGKITSLVVEPKSRQPDVLIHPPYQMPKETQP